MSLPRNPNRSHRYNALNRRKKGDPIGAAFVVTTLWVRSVIEMHDDFFAHLFGVTKQHHGVVLEEQFVLDAGIAC